MEGINWGKSHVPKIFTMTQCWQWKTGSSLRQELVLQFDIGQFLFGESIFSDRYIQTWRLCTAQYVHNIMKCGPLLMYFPQYNNLEILILDFIYSLAIWLFLKVIFNTSLLINCFTLNSLQKHWANSNNHLLCTVRVVSVRTLHVQVQWLKQIIMKCQDCFWYTRGYTMLLCNDLIDTTDVSQQILITWWGSGLVNTQIYCISIIIFRFSYDELQYVICFDFLYSEISVN